MGVPTRPQRTHVAGCARFWSWAVVGVLVGLSTLVLGAPVIVAVVLTAGVTAATGRFRRPALGFISGLGVPLLYVAWLNRAGPGTTCWRTTTGTGCDQHLNPLPWLLIGLGLFIVGVVAFARRGS